MRYLLLFLLLTLLYGCGITEPIVDGENESYFTLDKKKPKDEKVSVCQRIGSGKYILKEVKQKKVQGILDKGGGFPGESVSDMPGYSFTDDCQCFKCGDTFIDIRDGKEYATVLIGEKCWMKENLNYGTKIAPTLPMQNNSTVEKYCYNNIESNCTNYGGLYLWNEAMMYTIEAGSQGICPDGWHIPTKAEITLLETEANDNANNILAVGQISSANDITGFSALLSGFKYEGNNYSFYGLGGRTYIWGSTEINNKGYLLYIWTHVALEIYHNPFDKDYAFSVRCVY